jgi:hypothetical protein
MRAIGEIGVRKRRSWGGTASYRDESAEQSDDWVAGLQSSHGVPQHRGLDPNFFGGETAQ